MYAEEGTRSLSLWVFNRCQRLFDEQPASDYSVVEQLRKLDDRSPRGLQKVHSITALMRAASRDRSVQHTGKKQLLHCKIPSRRMSVWGQRRHRPRVRCCGEGA